MRLVLYNGFLLAFLAAAGMSACSKKTDTPEQERGALLAEVYAKKLYAKDLGDIIPEGAAGEDSLLLAQAYVQRWVKDQLLMYEAERNIPKDLNIDEMVRNYRASLVRFNFEEQLIAQEMDSVVSEPELRGFYEQNMDQFQLETTILKCLFIKLPAEAPANEMNKLWYAGNTDTKRLAAFAKRWAILALLDPDRWYKMEEVAALLPKGTLTPENVSSRKEGTLSDGDHRYYYRVLEVVRGKETAPFDYVREQALQIVLHKRKQDLLEKWKENLYQKEINRENVKVY